MLNNAEDMPHESLNLLHWSSASVWRCSTVADIAFLLYILEKYRRIVVFFRQGDNDGATLYHLIWWVFVRYRKWHCRAIQHNHIEQIGHRPDHKIQGYINLCCQETVTWCRRKVVWKGPWTIFDMFIYQSFSINRQLLVKTRLDVVRVLRNIISGWSVIVRSGYRGCTLAKQASAAQISRSS